MISPKGDSKAIGGFIEALVAVVAICCGIILISVSLTVAFPAMLDSGDRMEAEIDRALELLMGEVGLVLREGVIDANQLDNDSMLVEHLEGERSCIGIRISVVELYPEIQTVWSLTLGEGVDGGEVLIKSIPVNIQHSVSDIRPALLVISVW